MLSCLTPSSLKTIYRLQKALVRQLGRNVKKREWVFQTESIYSTTTLRLWRIGHVELFIFYKESMC
jgi:hypothetical protein